MARTRRLFHDFKEGIQKSVVKKHAAKLNKQLLVKWKKGALDNKKLPPLVVYLCFQNQFEN